MFTKMLSSIVAIIFCGSLVQAASIPGTWSGDLNYASSTGVTGVCHSTQTITVADSILTFKQLAEGDCSWEFEFTMDVQGADLYFIGMKVGSLTDNEFSIEGFPAGSDIFSAHLSLEADGTATYADHYLYNNNPADQDGLSGSLTQSNLPKVSGLENTRHNLK